MSDHRSATEHLFRHKYGEILAALWRYTGYENFETVEEAVQIAFQRALEKWLYTGVPDNPAGWLYAVARNTYLETIRRRKMEYLKLEQLHQQIEAPDDDRLATNELTQMTDVNDDLAMMLLLCCNPDLPPKGQICLTLKAACGFSVSEIAHALDMQEEAVKKTISRAKEKVATDRPALQAVRTDRVTTRFVLVLETLYALFNEGYFASRGNTQLRQDIAEEAIRLAHIFLDSTLTPTQYKGELYALIALMLCQFARFSTRTDTAGVPIRLQEQDRNQWNQEMIQAGLAALTASQVSEYVSIFHLEARIAAEHALSPSFSATRWPTILSLYDQLLQQKDTPAVRLSRIVAIHYAQGWEPAQRELDQLEASGLYTISQSFLFHAVRADLLEARGKSVEAVKEWQEAQRYAATVADRLFVEQKLKNVL